MAVCVRPELLKHSILDPLREWADRGPDRLLYTFLDIGGRPTEQYTYATFLARTDDIAAYLHQRLPSLGVGDRVLLAYPPGLEMICAFFACVRLGWIPVPVYPPGGQGFRASLYRMNFIAQDSGARAVLTDRSYYWSMKLNQTRHRIATLTFARDTVSALPWIMTSEAAGGEGSFPEGHSDVLFLQYTSGSTRQPRGVMVTHDNLLDNADAVVDHLPVGVSWLPQYHDMGLIGYYLNFAMKGGKTYGFSPIDFIRRPELWLETISRYRGTATSAPNFAYEFCLRPGKLPPETFEGLDLSSLRFLMTAAEPVRAQVFRDFKTRFAPYGLDPASYFSAYGLAEFTLAVSNYGRNILRVDSTLLQQGTAKTLPPGVPRDAGTELVSCGRPVGSAEVRIVDPEAPRVRADGQVGEVWLSGGSRCAGYWGRAELSEDVFCASLPETPGKLWLRTGDLGFLHEGELYLCGRIKDLIIIRGQNYYPQDVEQLAEEVDGIRKGCVAAFAHDDGETERLVVVAELRDPRKVPDTGALNRRIYQTLGVAVDTVVYIQPRTIPKTSSGKIMRHKVLESFKAGTLRVVQAIRPPDEPEPGIAGVGEQISLEGVGEVFVAFGLSGREEWTLAEAGLDSLRLVEFAEELKDFLAMRGHADLSHAVDVQVLQNIAICELGALLEQLATSPAHARLRFAKALTDLGREHRALEQDLMQRDTRLRFDPSHLPLTANRRLAKDTGILLTGGTGFFGPFLLSSLLQQTTRDIHVLVRAGDAAQGLERLRADLQAIAPGKPVPQAWLDRILPVCGDLTQTNLGLPTAQWNALAEQVDTIYNNGAWVNYLYDYGTLRAANVGGTNEIVRLAMSHRPKVLNHISTTFVFGWSAKEVLYEQDDNQDLDLLDFGYSQSKWVSEQVVRDAMRQGLRARIFRPALITPSVDGGGGSFDIAVRLLTFMVQHGIGTTAGNQVSFSPADLTADNIVSVALQPESLDQTFHVTRDVYASMQDITGILSDLSGKSFTHFPLAAFVPEVTARCRQGDILFPLLDFFLRSTNNITAMEFKRYDNANFRRYRDLAPHGRADPSLDDVVLGLWRFMLRHKLVDP